jgi:DNA-binding NtrC family response regulator
MSSVLLVEDDAGIRTVVRRLLELRGYGVVECETGSDALAAVQEHRGNFAFMVTDYALADLNGVELARRVRRIAAWVETLVISGHRHVAADCRRTDGLAFLAKPFGTAEFTRAMQNLNAPPKRKPAQFVLPPRFVPQPVSRAV